VPGLRSGFVAGDARLIQRNAQLINYGGVAVPIRSWRPRPPLARRGPCRRGARPLPRQLRSGRGDSGAAVRVCAPGRRLLLVARCRRRRDGRPPAVGRSRHPRAARRLYGAADESGVNPGQRYIRVALVYDTETTVAGLRRMEQVLSAAAAPARRLGAGQGSGAQAAAPA
jgi:N-succinyldiaminopimelate aminotransferase